MLAQSDGSMSLTLSRPLRSITLIKTTAPWCVGQGGKPQSYMVGGYKFDQGLGNGWEGPHEGSKYQKSWKSAAATNLLYLLVGGTRSSKTFLLKLLLFFRNFCY